MASDPCNVKTCESYSWLLIRTRKFKEALKLLKYSYGVKGIDLPKFMRLEALVHESLKEFSKARDLLSAAIQKCYDSDYITFLEEEMQRVERKELYSKGPHYQIVG